MTVETIKRGRGVAPVSLNDPYADELTQPFWLAALEGRMLGYKCKCGRFSMPPSRMCPACHGREGAWVDLPGTGEVYSFIVIRHPLRPNMQDTVPYVTAAIDIDGTQGAGARMTGNIIDCKPEDVKIGAKVKVVFDKVSETFAVPRWRLV